jgi:rubrerythrin
MAGGIRSWEGLTATGAPEAGMVYFSDADTPEELIALAWELEEGSRKFYTVISAMLSDMESVALFNDLSTAEEHHKATLANLYKNSTKKNLEAIITKKKSVDIMEGGIKVREALAWAENRDVQDILEFAISLEANAYDLYIKMGRKIEDTDSKKIFVLLSEEEKKHLERMAQLLGKKI